MRMGSPADRLPQDLAQLHLSWAAEPGAQESTWDRVAEELPCELGRPGSPARWPTSRAAAVPPRRRRRTAPIYSGHFTFERPSHEDH